MQDMVSPTLPMPMNGEPFSRLVNRRPLPSTCIFPDLVAKSVPKVGSQDLRHAPNLYPV